MLLSACTLAGEEEGGTVNKGGILVTVMVGLFVPLGYLIWLKPWEPVRLSCYPQYYLAEETTTSQEKKEEMILRYFFGEGQIKDHENMKRFPKEGIVAAAVAYKSKMTSGGEGFAVEFLVEDSQGVLHHVVSGDGWARHLRLVSKSESSTCDFEIKSEINYLAVFYLAVTFCIAAAGLTLVGLLIAYGPTEGR